MGDTYHHRFWGQVMRWAAADKPLVAGNDHVRFGTREPVYRQGSEIDLIVRLGENEKPLAGNALAAARLIRLEAKCNDLEDYIDALLARVMDAAPDILAHHPKIVCLLKMIIDSQGTLHFK